MKLLKTEYCNCLAVCVELFMHPTISKNGICIICDHYTVKEPNVHSDKKFEEELDKKLKQEERKLQRQNLACNMGRPQTDTANVYLIEKIKMVKFFIKEGKI